MAGFSIKCHENAASNSVAHSTNTNSLGPCQSSLRYSTLSNTGTCHR